MTVEILVGAISGAISAGLTVFLGASGFLGQIVLQRLQSGYETQLAEVRTRLDGKIRAMQANLDRTVLVHRVHFETEFTALREMWDKVAAVRSTLSKVRPMVDVVPRDETPEQRDAREVERFNAFVVDFNALVKAVDSQSPFIPEGIYNELSELILIARREETEVTSRLE